MTANTFLVQKVGANGKLEDRLIALASNSLLGVDNAGDFVLFPNALLDGKINPTFLPDRALEVTVTAANATARKALTTASVQRGDRVKETDTGLIYTLNDESQIATDAGWLLTSTVQWADILGKPVESPVLTGTVLDWAGASEPAGYLFCYGQAVSRTTFAALFAIIGTTFGAGNGTTTFNLPDLRGRVVAGADDMGGSAAGRLSEGAPGGVDTPVLGGSGGEERNALASLELATHSHSIDIYDSAISTTPGTSSVQGVSESPTNTIGSQNTGTSESHNNTQPTLILNKIIKT